MKETKKLFWSSIIMVIIGSSLILLFELVPSADVYCDQFYDIMINIGCSLLVSAIVLTCTNYIAFFAKRKNYMYRYYSIMYELRNCVIEIINWHNWIKNRPTDTYDEIECDKFVNKLNKIKHFEFSRIYEITDDFCSLWSRKPSVTLLNMNALLSFIQANYNIHYNQKLSRQLFLVEEHDMPKEILCRTVLKEKFCFMNHEENLDKINFLFSQIMKDSKIKEYENKINKNN